MKKTTIAFLLLALVLMPVAAFANDAAATFDAKCKSCHGADGKKLAKADLTSQTIQAKADADLVKFLTSKEYGRALARTNLLQPARASLVEEWIGFVRNEFVTAAAAADLATFASSHLSGESVTVETFANMNGVRAVTDGAFEEILTLGQAAVDERLPVVCEAINAIQQGAAAPAAGGCCA